MSATEPITWTGSGPVGMGDYDPENGTPDMGYLVNIRRIGCANRSLSLTPSSESTPITESCSGQQLEVDEIPGPKSMGINLTMEMFSGRELGMAYFGDTIVVPAGTVTGERLPTLAPGDIFFLKNPRAKSIVIEDSTEPTPIEYVLGTHYRLVSDSNESQSAYQLIAHPASHAEPVLVDYEYDESINIPTMTRATVEKGLIFLGRNHHNRRARIIIPRVSWTLGGDFNWLTTGQAAQMQFNGRARYAGELSADPMYGPYARIDWLP